MPFNCVYYGWVGKGLGAAMLGLLLGGCDGTLTADLATDPPADTAIRSVQVNLRGLDLPNGRRHTDDAGVSIRANWSTCWICATGIRCDCSRMRACRRQVTPACAALRRGRGRECRNEASGDIPLVLAEGAYATVDFSVEDQKSSTEKLSLMLDLRQSLSYEKARNRYTLTPVLRSVSTDDAARIEGVVTVVCPLGTLLVPGEAAYLFAGKDVSPDDLDSAGVEPFATTSVVRSATTALVYSLRFLPAGDYTLALTCNGNDDVLGVDDDLRFRNVTNVRINNGDVVLRNFN